MSLSWGEASESRGKELEMDYKVIPSSQVTKLDPQGNIIRNENFDYQLVDKSGKAKTVTKEEFLKAGSLKGMKPDRRSLMTIDNNNKKIIAKFEKFNNSRP